jgi:hypothetical protein
MVKKKNKQSKARRPASQGQVAVVSGQGGYVTDLARQVGRHVFTEIKKATPPGTFQKLGTLGGAYFGHPIAGGLLGKGISKLLGWGAYEVRANSLMGKQLDEGPQVPSFGNMTHSTRVRHREFIGDITANGGLVFTNTSYPINAGLEASFPWLCQIARAYDQYRFHGIVYEFRSTFSDISTGGALGSVIMATDYDATDASFTSKLFMENAQYSTSAKPSQSFVHCVECDPQVSGNQSKLYYSRSGGIPSGTDARMFDLGNFQIATVGLPVSSGNIGELWVTYDVELIKPTMYGDLNVSHFNLAANISTSAYFDTTAAFVYPSSGATTEGKIKTSTFYFPEALSSGKYVIQYSVYGASTTLTASLSPTLTNCSQFALFNQTGTDSFYTNVAGGAVSNHQILVFCVSISAPNATVAITGGTLPGTITGGDLVVTRLPSALT